MGTGTTTFSAVLEAYLQEGGEHLVSPLSSNVPLHFSYYYDLLTSYSVYLFAHFTSFLAFGIVWFVLWSSMFLLLMPVFYLLPPLLRKLSQWSL